MNAAGTVFPFGDATDLGNFPVETGPYRALAATQDGRGLWAVTEGPAGVGGHVHSLGSARSFGNFANACCGHCCDGLVAPTNGLGLMGLRSDGTVLVLGRAPNLGNFPVVPGDAYMGMIATPSGRGLTAVTESGRVRTLGEATFFGDLSDDPGACISCVP